MWKNNHRPRWRSHVALTLGALVLLVGCAGGKSSTTTAHTTPTAVGVHGTVINWQNMPKATLSTYVDRYISTMSLDAKIGQLLMLQFTTVGYQGDSITMMRRFQPGALILYKYEMPNAASTIDMTSRAQADAKIPLIISADQEGGAIDNLTHIYGWRPTATEIGAKNDPQFAYDQGVKNAKDLLSLGLNADLAPDVDVQLVNGPDQSSRTFGTTPDQVTKMAGAWLNGLQQNGVMGTLKHFPGLGAATIDAHLGLPIINRTRDQLEQVEFAPYRNLINSANPPEMIMPTDVLMPALDPKLPAEVSEPIINGVLRKELHYDGVVVTDALYMQGVGFDQYQAGVLALKAGCDLLLGPSDSTSAQYMVDAIKNALTSGDLPMSRINESVHRLLMLKARHGMLPFTPDPLPGQPAAGLTAALPAKGN